MTGNEEIRVNISRAKAAAVGEAHGVTPRDLREIQPRILAAHAILLEQRREKKYGFFDLYRDTDALAQVKAKAAEFLAKGYENFVVLGIGGSALGTIALHTALNPRYYNLLGKKARKGYPRLFVMDNIDPMTFRAMMRLCPPKRTLYNAISRSGETAETLAQLMIVADALVRKLGTDSVKDHLVVTTLPRVAQGSKSLLHPVAEQFGLTSFDIPTNVGGRFSVFSPVGMFPAAMLGMDLDALAAGCAAMDARCSQADMKKNPAYLRAAFQYIMDTKKGKTMTVMMPYADCLCDVADWYRQLWAESLGKRFDLDGKEVFAGQTPIKALGATDQHSQVQLYREGPNNKVFTIVEVRRFDRSLRIPDTLSGIPAVEYLLHKSMNKLMSAELRGTMDALKVSQRPVMHITLSRVNAYTVAQLLYMFEVETAMAGRLYNVNAFDQPGVEEGKRIARRLMGAGG